MVSDQLLRRSMLLVSLSAFAMLAGCGGSSSNSSHSNANNVQAIAVDGGPVAGQLYPNGAFTSVTICAPGSSNCQTVGGVLVDTGSTGLRILASAIPGLNLPQMTSNGNNLFNCVSFVDGSFLWGPLVQADVKIAGEVASSAGVHVVEDPNGFGVPSACSNGGSDSDNQQALGANGILGVGPEPQDCGPACDPSRGGTPPPVYFACSSKGSCQTAFVSIGQQVVQPVVKFGADNNGVVIQFPAVNGVAGTLAGSLIFGIGTQSNNQLGQATIFTLNNFDNFTTKFSAQTLGTSFIDSGSNGLFFTDSSIPQCASSSIAPGFFCPAALVKLSAQTVGTNNAAKTVNFAVDNAVNLFNSNNGAAAYVNLGGPSFGGPSFDWGLPFFYGRSVFTSIDGQAPPTNTPSAPWWAF